MYLCERIMFRTVIILCTLFSLAGCHEQVKVHKTMATGDGTSAMDSSGRYSDVRLTEDEETTVEMCIQENGNTVSVKKPCIDVCNLALDVPEAESFYVSADMYNNTGDTICFSNNSFMYYDEANSSWTALPYPDNFTKEDIGIYIAPHTRQSNKFFFPVRKDNMQGKYKIQLAFYSRNGKYLYYATKTFGVK